MTKTKTKTTSTKAADVLADIMRRADYKKSFSLWGGTTIGICTHALQRSINRFDKTMTFSSLANLIVDTISKGGAALEDVALYETTIGGQIVIYDRSIKTALFLRIGYNAKTKLNEIFLQTIYTKMDWQTIFCEASNEHLLAVTQKNIELNPVELKFRNKIKH